MTQLDTDPEWITERHVVEIIQRRDPFSHKGNYGHALLVAGGFGKMGAAVLAARACLRTGVGLLSVNIPGCGYDILQTAAPEAMVICDGNQKIISAAIGLDNFSTIGVGCGMGNAPETANAVKQLVQHFEKPMVIDADAINILSENQTWLEFVPPNSIFTPHPKEFERLVGKTDSEQTQLAFSKKYQVFMALKGHHTRISCPNGKQYANTTGNAGMAKGGSGDALTGMLTALLAQGYAPEQACVAGIYLHGLAGDVAVQALGEFSLLASDLIENIGKAFLKTMSKA